MIQNTGNTLRRAAAGLLAALALSLTACGKDATSAVSDTQKQAIVLTANGMDFTAEQYAASFVYNANRMDSMLAMYGQKTSADMTEAAEKEAFSKNIAELAKQQLVYLAVCENQMQEKGLSYTDEEVDAQLTELSKQLGDDAEFDKYLKDMGLTRDQYREFAKLNVMIQKLRDNYYAQNPNAAREYFDKNYLRCKHVLIKTVDDNNAELPDQEARKAKAEEVAKRAKNGESFDALIQSQNEDPGMESNPEGYVFTDGEMVPEFYEGTKALADNAISDPIKTSYGWHIIQRLPLRDTDFESKKGVIEETLFSDIASEWLSAADVEEKNDISQINLETASGYLA